MSQKYAVGQVLFVVSSERERILPCQVVEQISKKTLQGDEVIYKVMFGIDPKNVMDLNRIKDKVFTSLEDVRSYLLENTTRWVTAHVEKANVAAANWYQYSESKAQQLQQKQALPDVSNIALEEENLIELPSGQVVRAKVQGL